MKVLMIFILIGMIPYVSAPDSNSLLQKKARVRLQLEYFNIDGSEYLNVKVTGKLEKKFKPVEEIGVSIYLMEQTEPGLMGRIITNARGVASLQLPETYYAASDTLNEMQFIAVLDTTPVYQDKEARLTIRKVNLETRFIDQDSLKQIRAYVTELDSGGNKVPQKNVAVKFFVDRPLSRLPIGDLYNATNKAGEVSVYFPTDFPGDTAGNVTLFVRIDDNDDYGNVEVSEILPWGVPIQFNDKTIARSLWASGANAPIPLLLLVSALVIAVWGILFYIVYEVYKISKI